MGASAPVDPMVPAIYKVCAENLHLSYNPNYIIIMDVVTLKEVRKKYTLTYFLAKAQNQ